MKDKLKQLGLRLEGNFTLHSGLKSNIKWDIEKLFKYSLSNRLSYLRPWHKEILRFIRGRDLLIVGIPTGGYSLGLDFARFYGLRYAHCKLDLSPWVKKWKALIIDDVLTTGSTVKEYFDKVDVLGIAILVNRSQMKEINGIPIISGFYADEVN